MAFWGVEVKPGKPYTHSSKDGRGRLRISQATLANGSAPKKSLVQCNVGDKSPVLLCALLPDKTESLQLDLEFEEAEDVIFSVIGPRGVYLTGYYVGHSLQSNIQDDTESYGEDIANSETQNSSYHSDEDEYEDSFINDDEPDPFTPSPVSSSRGEEHLKKKRNGNGGCKRLKKKYHIFDTDDEISVPEIDDEDYVTISSICKDKKSEASGKKTNKEMTTDLDMTKNEDAVDVGLLDSKDKVDVHLVDDETKGTGGQPSTPMLSLAEVVPENKPKPKKKRRESSTEDKEANTNNSNKTSLLENVATEESKKPNESLLPPAPVPLSEEKTKAKKKGHSKKGDSDKAKDENFMDHDALASKDDKKPHDTVVGDSLKVLDSAEVVPENNLKSKKKRKGRNEVKADDADNNQHAGNKQEDDQQAIQEKSGIDSNQLANGDLSEEKVKKKRRKTSKTQDVEENTQVNTEKEDKPCSTEPEEKEDESCKKKTLSNGLVIEDLVIGNSKGKIAETGRKVKVNYVVKLKENGKIIDSNGKAFHKFRLGDKEVIEGLNVGLAGMRAGDKRRVTIPPSMSLGYKGTGENVPPNSWLVYDVEVISIH